MHCLGAYSWIPHHLLVVESISMVPLVLGLLTDGSPCPFTVLFFSCCGSVLTILFVIIFADMGSQWCASVVHAWTDDRETERD